MQHYDVEPLPGVEPQIGLLQAVWRDSTREWRKNLGEVSDEAIAWQPFPGGHSIGGVLLHMIACETWWISILPDGPFRLPGPFPGITNSRMQTARRSSN